MAVGLSYEELDRVLNPVIAVDDSSDEEAGGMAEVAEPAPPVQEDILEDGRHEEAKIIESNVDISVSDSVSGGADRASTEGAVGGGVGRDHAPSNMPATAPEAMPPTSADDVSVFDIVHATGALAAARLQEADVEAGHSTDEAIAGFPITTSGGESHTLADGSSTSIVTPDASQSAIDCNTSPGQDAHSSTECADHVADGGTLADASDAGRGHVAGGVGHWSSLQLEHPVEHELGDGSCRGHEAVDIGADVAVDQSTPTVSGEASKLAGSKLPDFAKDASDLEHDVAGDRAVSDLAADEPADVVAGCGLDAATDRTYIVEARTQKTSSMIDRFLPIVGLDDASEAPLRFGLSTSAGINMGSDGADVAQTVRLPIVAAGENKTEKHAKPARSWFSWFSCSRRSTKRKIMEDGGDVDEIASKRSRFDHD